MDAQASQPARGSVQRLAAVTAFASRNNHNFRVEFRLKLESDMGRMVLRKIKAEQICLRAEENRRRAKIVGVPTHEKLLAAKLITAIKKKSNENKQKNIIIASEFDCFQGIADVVAGTFNGYRLLPESGNRNLKCFTLSTSRILSALSNKRRSNIPEVLKATGLSISTVRKELNSLRKIGFLEITDRARISIVHPIRPPFKEIEAFEVKMKDWKGGIYQARNYKSFAHKVSVVLPLDRARLLKKRWPEFRRMRVGLLGIAPTGELEWFLKPRRLRPISGPRSFLAAMNLLRTTDVRIS